MRASPGRSSSWLRSRPDFAFDTEGAGDGVSPGVGACLFGGDLAGVKPEQAEKVDKAAQELKDAISSNNIDNIKAKTQDLKTILGQISTKVTELPHACADGRC